MRSVLAMPTAPVSMRISFDVFPDSPQLSAQSTLLDYGVLPLAHGALSRVEGSFQAAADLPRGFTVAVIVLYLI
jgi:hypothetical protein